MVSNPEREGPSESLFRYLHRNACFHICIGSLCLCSHRKACFHVVLKILFPCSCWTFYDIDGKLVSMFVSESLSLFDISLCFPTKKDNCRCSMSPVRAKKENFHHEHGNRLSNKVIETGFPTQA